MKDQYRQVQTEFDTAYLYQKIAEAQKDESHRQVLLKLSAIEMEHAEHALQALQKHDAGATMPGPSFRARMQLAVGKIFGFGAVINQLTTLEKKIAQNTVKAKRNQGAEISGYEHNHLRIIEALSAQSTFQISAGILKDYEGKHKAIGGNALRASVLGFNDGLVSNLSLVMGVTGAQADDKVILLTGIAGLLAGAISMAMGEWLSVQSSRELYMHQIAQEEAEIENAPEQEQRELALLYQAKGMQAEEAERLAAEVFQDKSQALDTMIVEELGIDKDELGGSAREAAFASFSLFAVGALIPLFPYLLITGIAARYWSICTSIAGLFLVGVASALFTGRSFLFSGLRQIIFGLGAAAVTYGVGYLIGVQLAG